MTSHKLAIELLSRTLEAHQHETERMTHRLRFREQQLAQAETDKQREAASGHISVIETALDGQRQITLDLAYSVTALQQAEEAGK